MKKEINLYRLYLAFAIIILIIISSISTYFVLRELVTKKYISNDNYISMFYDEYFSENCWFDSNYEKKITDKNIINKCIQNKKNKLIEKRDFRYNFNLIKYGTLLFIVLILLFSHSFLYLISNKKK